MIAVIFESGAIIYDLSESQADEFARRQSLITTEHLEYERGWIFIDPKMPYILNRIGIDVCYVDLNNMTGKHKNRSDYMKISISKLTDIWSELYPIKDRIIAKR